MFIARAISTAALVMTAFTSAASAARPVTKASPPDPRALVGRAISAVQGSASLASLHSVHEQGMYHEYLLGNAERAEGPWRIMYLSFDQLRDADADRIRRAERAVGTATPVDRITIITDSVMAARGAGRETAGSPSAYESMMTRIVSSPDRALQLARASSSLRWDRTVRRYGLDFDVVSFPWRNGRMRLELSRESHFPVAVEVVRPYPDDFRWGVFGDVNVRTDFVDWNVQPNGMWWPMQQTTFFNGQPLRDITVNSVTLDSVRIPSDTFAVSDSTRVKYAATYKTAMSALRLGFRGPPTELRKDIIRVPDQWTETMVKQDDGIVLFENHISADWLKDVIAEAHKRYPGVPVKAIVMTSDPWAHLGGFREAVALGIPIYVKDASVPFLTALAKTAHTMLPDALAKAPRPPRFIPVSAKTVIGTGVNRIELYPVGGEYGERMLMAYFPSHKLLYGADLIFPNRGPDGKVGAGFSVTPASDLRAAIRREKLDVDAIFCVQNYPVFDGPAFMRNESKPYVQK